MLFVIGVYTSHWDCPDIFHQIAIQRLGRPLKLLDAALTEPRFCGVAPVDGCIILLIYEKNATNTS
jgi:hypothetical protein